MHRKGLALENQTVGKPKSLKDLQSNCQENIICGIKKPDKYPIIKPFWYKHTHYFYKLDSYIIVHHLSNAQKGSSL